MRRLTTEEIKERIIEKFGDKFDLSQVEYKGDKVAINFTCPKHRLVTITPNNLWKSPCGCPHCSRENREVPNKMTTERFIKESIEKHKGKYTYKNTEFIDGDTRVTITCPIHGDFPQLPYHHLNGHGCPKCVGRNKTTESVIEEFIQVHGDKYNYSKVDYKGDRTPVTITCPIHGDFPQTPNRHLQGNGCKHCARERINAAVRKRILPFSEFLKEAREIHGDKYEYDEINYKDSHTPIHIKCKDCGYEFDLAPYRHIRGEKTGCQQCARKETGIKQRKTPEQFILDAIKVHGNKYDYSKTQYVRAHDDVTIICPKHGEFELKANDHLNGIGCSICNESRLERSIRLFLQDNHIPYEPQSHINGLLGRQSVDFYLPQYNLAIECQGKQHFGDGGWGDNFELTYYRDIKKAKTLKKNNIDLIYYTTEDKDVVFNHETELYNSTNTYFDLSFLNNLTPKRDVVKDITEEIKSHIKGIEIIENHEIGDTVITLYFPRLHVGINITDVNIGTEWKYGFDRYYRLKQTDECIGKRIRLIQLFSDEWFANKTLVLNKISHILNLSFDKPSIFGRKCTIKEIDKKTAFKFLDKNHIQGHVGATVYLGAFHEETLVGVMSFINLGEGKWDLNRFATDNNYRCNGLGGKLFKYFVNHYQPQEIKSFADRRWTINYENNLYVQLGFQLVETLAPEYRYCNANTEPNIRYHKFGFRKKNLHKKYGLPMDLTETEMVKKIGYDRIWDCGLLKYVWKENK